jgi:hypothetical protein
MCCSCFKLCYFAGAGCLSPAGPGLTSREAPSLIKPMPPAKAQKLIQGWTQSAPRKLAW